MSLAAEPPRHEGRGLRSPGARMLPGAARRSAFTLIEIMVVMAIIMTVMTAGVPSIMRSMQRDDLYRALNDTVEGCKTARDRAILQGIPYEFVLAADGRMSVNALPLPPGEGFLPDGGGAASKAVPAGPYAGFPRQLGEDVIIQMVDVNFLSRMDDPEARVRFYPNGTCDEFTVVYNWRGKQRTAMADIVTGHVTEFIRE